MPTKPTLDPAAGLTWVLGGDLIVTVAPGPRLLIAACYSHSPVGRYLELAVAEPALGGLRPGVRVTTMAVDSPESRDAGRSYWGFPKELATLQWQQHDEQRSLRWEEEGIDVRATASGPTVPVVIPGWAVQRLGEDQMAVALRVRGKARLARVQVVSPSDGSFSQLSGSRPGALVAASAFTVGPTRRC